VSMMEWKIFLEYPCFVVLCWFKCIPCFLSTHFLASGSPEELRWLYIRFLHLL
jgi:hypothetical protein